MNFDRGLGEIALAGLAYVSRASKGLRCPAKRPCDETSAGHAMQYVGVQSAARRRKHRAAQSMQIMQSAQT